MLRAVRFAARFNFAIEPETERAIRQLASRIPQVSRERVRDELTRMLTEGHARRAFELLDRDRPAQRSAARNHASSTASSSPREYHPEGDVWIHTLLLLEKLPAGVLAAPSPGARCCTTLASPPPSRASARPHPLQRSRRGRRPHRCTRSCRRLRFSNEDCAQILALVENHMRFGDVEKMKESTLKRFFRLPRFEEHLELHRIDSLSSHGDLSLWEFARRRREELPDEVVRPPLLVTGRDLIAAGYTPGPRFKEMLALAEDAQLEGRIHTREEGLELIRREFSV